MSFQWIFKLRPHLLWGGCTSYHGSILKESRKIIPHAQPLVYPLRNTTERAIREGLQCTNWVFYIIVMVIFQKCFNGFKVVTLVNKSSFTEMRVLVACYYLPKCKIMKLENYAIIVSIKCSQNVNSLLIKNPHHLNISHQLQTFNFGQSSL